MRKIKTLHELYQERTLLTKQANELQVKFDAELIEVSNNLRPFFHLIGFIRTSLGNSVGFIASNALSQVLKLKKHSVKSTIAKFVLETGLQLLGSFIAKKSKSN